MNKLPSNKRVTNSNVLVLQTTFSQCVSKLEKEKTRVVPNSIVMQAAQYQSPVYLNKQEGSTDSVINRDESVPVVDTEKGSRMLLREPSQLTNRRKLMIGLVIVLVIACSWVGATQTAKSSYTNGFSAPYFVTWFTTSWMILVFPLTAPLYFLTGRAKLNTAGVSHLLRHSAQVFSPQGLTLVSFLTSTVLFTLIWAGTNYMYSRALVSTHPTDVTALFSSAPAFVFLLSVVVLREPPLILRFGAVLLVISGITLFAYVDGFESANIVGVVLSVGSAFGAALYKVLIKWRVGDATLYQMSLFLSTLGLFSTLCLWPIPLALHLTGVELLTNIPWGYLCISALLSVIFNFSINFGIVYTFPLFISLGTVMGIPLSAVVDSLFRNVDFFDWKFPATDLIVGGFILMLLPPDDSQCLQKGCVKAVSCKSCQKQTKET